MNQNKIELRKVRDFGSLLNVIFEYIKFNFKSLLKSNLLIGAPTILLAGVFLGIYQSSLFSIDVDSTIPQIGLPFLLSTFLTMVSYYIIMVVTYSHLCVYKQSETGIFDIEDVWQKTKQNFLMLLFTVIGYSFILGIIGLLFVGLGFYLTYQGNYGFIFLIFIGIGMLIYLTISYSLVFIVRIEEEITFFAALKRSKNLIKDNWWFTFGLTLVVGLIQSFILYALYIPTYVVMFFITFSGVVSDTGSFSKILFIVTSIITSLGAILYTISTLAIAFQYYNLVERKEAPGLLQKVENIN
jgi:hypothetical protein